MKVSVVIATYNGEKYICEQLDSILNQTYPVFEILIKDDCSIDHTISIVKRYQKKYPNIRLIENKKNIGVWTNFLEGFYLVTGEYIAYCDQDDIWLPNRIERMIPFMKGRNMVYCNSSVCDEKGNILYSLREKTQFVTEIVSMFDLQVWGHQMLFRKDLLYKEDLIYLYKYISLDALLAIVAFQGDDNNVYYLDENLVYWRRSGTSVTGIYDAKSPFGIQAFLNSIKSMFIFVGKNKKSKTKLFFKYILTLRGLSDKSKKVATNMVKASFCDLIDSSFICLSDCMNKYKKITCKEKVRILLKPFITVKIQFKYIGK